MNLAPGPNLKGEFHQQPTRRVAGLAPAAWMTLPGKANPLFGIALRSPRLTLRLASGAELGINRDTAGIVELESESAMLAPDSIIEVDNKSLTHRPDLWGHHGIAREVAAITHNALRDPVDLTLLPAAGSAAVQVEIADLNLCARYSALVFDNVTIHPSPLWLQARMMAIGLNPISNIVDMTNYVMAELAQPMHALDADLLKGDTIFIRRAKPGEHFRALVGAL